MEKYCPKCFKKYGPQTQRCPQDGSYLVSPMDKDLTGEVLDDRYTVMERIGRGGMGVVYKAEQHLIKRIVALKVLRREIVQDETAVKRFLNEARAIASLDSRHTVTLHDFGVTHDGLLYYTMELLKGRPLSRVIRDEAPIHHARAAGLIVQACRSLEEAHGHGILHRDIKPDNLFVTEKDAKEHLKVLDFGVAKLVGDAAMDTVTRTGMIVGTPQYLSPEQALGNPVVPASDLYSLGIVLYEMLAGVPPFQDETPMKTMWAQIRDPVPPLRKKNPKVEVPRSIEAFLARALEKDPNSRFQTATTFADALRTAVEDHEASPETVSLPALSTTDEGLRLKTQAWEAAAPKALGARPEACAQVARPRSSDDNARAEPGHAPAVVSRDDLRPGIEEPGPTTMGRILAGHRRWYWGIGAAALILVALGVWWAPWQGGWPPAMEPASGQRTRSDIPVTEPVGGVRTEPGAEAGVARAEPQTVAPHVPQAVEGAPTAVGGGEAKAEDAEAAAMKASDEATKRADEEAAKKAVEEAEKKRAADAAAAQQAAEIEAAKQKAEQEAARKAAEEAAAQKAAEEAKKAGDAEAAKKKAEEAAKRKAEEQEAAKRAAAAEAARQKAEEEARKLAEQEAAEKATREREATVTKGRESMALGRYEEAIAFFSQAKSKGADAGEMDGLTRKCYDGIRQREVKELVRKGDLAIQRQKWGECIEHFEAAVKLGGSKPELESKLKQCREMSVFQ